MSEVPAYELERFRCEAIVFALKNGPLGDDLMALVQSWPGSEFADERNNNGGIIVNVWLVTYANIDGEPSELRSRVKSQLNEIADTALATLRNIGCEVVFINHDDQFSHLGAQMLFQWIESEPPGIQLYEMQRR